MIKETNPPPRMLQENIGPLLERLPLFMMKHVLGLKRLVNRQINRVVRIGNPPGRVGRLFFALLVDDVLGRYHVLRLVVSAETLATLQGGRDTFVVGLAEARRSVAAQALQERQTLRRFGLVFARRRLLLVPCEGTGLNEIGRRDGGFGINTDVAKCRIRYSLYFKLRQRQITV